MAGQGLPPEPPQVIDLGAAGKGKSPDSDALAEFHPEADWPHEIPASAPRATQPRTSPSKAVGISFPAQTDIRSSPYVWIVVLLAAVAIAEAPFVAMWIWERAGRPAGANNAGVTAYGTVHVETAPEGMEVWVNGGAAGRTPTQLSIPAGAAEIQLRHADRVHTVPLTIAPEETLRLRVELPATIEGSVELLSERATGGSTDMAVVVSPRTEDPAAVPDTALELPDLAGPHSRALAFGQPAPAR